MDRLKSPRDPLNATEVEELNRTLQRLVQERRFGVLELERPEHRARIGFHFGKVLLADRGTRWRGSCQRNCLLWPLEAELYRRFGTGGGISARSPRGSLIA